MTHLHNLAVLLISHHCDQEQAEHVREPEVPPREGPPAPPLRPGGRAGGELRAGQGL